MTNDNSKKPISDENQLESYLTTFKKNLKRLPKDEQDDITNEIRSHAIQSLQSGKTLQNVLDRFGPPTLLARQYVVESYLASATQQNSLLKIFRVVGLWALWSWPSMVVFPLLIGFVVSFAAAAMLSVIVTVASPFLPREAISLPMGLAQISAIPIGIGIALICVLMSYVSYFILRYYIGLIRKSFSIIKSEQVN